MDTKLVIRCTDVKPVVHRASRGVAGWICRIDVHTANATGFDFIQVPTPDPWRTVEQWTGTEIEALLTGLLNQPVDPVRPVPPYLKKFRELVGIVQFRQDFTIDESISLLTAKGAPHELTGSELSGGRCSD